MSTQVTNYQCLNCNGPLRFVGESGQLECEYCSTKFDVAAVEQFYADKEQAAAAVGTEPQWDLSMAGGNWSEEEAAKMRGYVCPSCGAEIICDDTTIATSCHYCGNQTVVPGQFSGMLRPNYVIPFKLDKKAAVEALKNYYKGKKFLPKAFASNNHIDEIKGVYVPFWLFDGEAFAYMRFKATRVHKHRSGDYETIITEHYRIVRQGNIAFEKIPVDGSSKMPDTHMDAIEPFDYGDLTGFSSAYLPGYMADKYDQDAEFCSKRANERITVSTEDALTATATGYTTLVREHSSINLKQGDVKYAMMPVWMLSTKWSGKNFLFAMNGQTGKLIGDLPVDKGKFMMWMAGISVPLMAVLGVLLLGGVF